MPTTYIIGHQKPDTDSVVAALAATFMYQSEQHFGHDKPEAVIVDPLNPETTYLFNRFDLNAPRLVSATDISPEDRIVLVDHNEESQRLPSLPQDQIVEIIDHHKVNLNLGSPILLTFKPWGSTASIIYSMMEQNDIEPDETLAGLMLAAILSDTVGFKSATTTDIDRSIGEKLATIANIDDIEQFAFDIMKAKSDISTLTPEQIVQNDYKIYEFSKQVFVNQLETVEQTEIIANRKQKLLDRLEAMKQEHDVELAFMAVSDVLQVNTKLLLPSEAEVAVAEKAFGGTATDGVLDIGPKLSRKKEIAPALEKVLA